MRAALIIPALNEEASIEATLDEVPTELYEQILVVDNGSSDRTFQVALSRGVTVLSEPRRGYGNACLCGLAALSKDIDVVVFMDADGSDVPLEAERLLAPIVAGHSDVVLGSRTLGDAEVGSLNTHQRTGNVIATLLIRLFWRYHYTDLGPFRALRLSSLRELKMSDSNYGWTIEMQINAIRAGLRIAEVPVSYRRRRAGCSKVSGSVCGSFSAGVKILWTVVRLRLTHW
ncbi:MAG: UDP-glucose--dolichyl-phosphate glucosyltransferase [Solibacterales bacterium]|nr:UDP-glucose--dolichyl-phosphate glucosyltransferase [Bryobacterales bacterium]|tara:strand:- start:2448 stop:3137 length:690 start_codon:yes stop_codon:yes gene_type:complete